MKKSTKLMIHVNIDGQSSYYITEEQTIILFGLTTIAAIVEHIGRLEIQIKDIVSIQPY